MTIKGKVHCFFEQSGTFKREFIKLGIPAEDYDIQNNFGETDHVTDLFKAIEDAYDGKPSVFDAVTKDDLIMAFFPCIYFECWSMMLFTMGNRNYRNLSDADKIDAIIKRAEARNEFYITLIKFCGVCIRNGIRMIFENPWAMQHFLKQGNFLKQPDLVDSNRTMRGDHFIKPTAYWFFNCSPSHCFSPNKSECIKHVINIKKGIRAGICSEERSMISHDYARNFICDFILGGGQTVVPQQCDLFDELEKSK